MKKCGLLIGSLSLMLLSGCFAKQSVIKKEVNAYVEMQNECGLIYQELQTLFEQEETLYKAITEAGIDVSLIKATEGIELTQTMQDIAKTYQMCVEQSSIAVMNEDELIPEEALVIKHLKTYHDITTELVQEVNQLITMQQSFYQDYYEEVPREDLKDKVVRINAQIEVFNELIKKQQAQLKQFNESYEQLQQILKD